MLRKELQQYFDEVYPHSKIEAEHSLGGQVNIRFELGGKLDNGTVKRVNQAVKRGSNLFNDLFIKNNEIWLLIYEYLGDSIYENPNEFLHELISPIQNNESYNEIENIQTPYFTTNQLGEKVPEKEDVRVIIRRIKPSEIDIEKIIRGIANLEMGFSPKIEQRLYFFDPILNKAFHMYDDRGCYIWSNQANTIRSIYTARNEWIANYHRSEIDRYFLS